MLINRTSLREFNQLREIKFTRNYTAYAEGSVLVEFGNTKVICTATIEETVPLFLKNKGTGWVTAEYSMLPRATHSRSKREITQGKPNARTQEIQRLIGRSLRSAVDLQVIGARQIIIDCDVLFKQMVEHVLLRLVVLILHFMMHCLNWLVMVNYPIYQLRHL